VGELGESANKIYNAFTAYIDTLDKAVNEQFPELVEEAEKLAGRAEQAKDEA
jgi:hypothetical protein